MVIEANRDAAKECVKKASEAFRRNDLEKMRNFLAKAKKLDPDCDVDAILRNGHPMQRSASDADEDRSYSHDDHYDDANGLRNRKAHTGSSQHRRPSTGSSPKDDRQARSSAKDSPQPTASTSRAKSRSKSGARTAEALYTKEEAEMVNRIRHCKDYYEILQVSRDANVTVLKKKYYELALKLHPDKCKAPGATEAFKALGNAYGVLSDPKKRDDYDRFGSEEERASVRRQRHHSDFYEFDVGRGFEAEMSPEDIFDMFFGGGVFTRGPVHRRRAHFHHHAHREEPAREETSPLFQLLQILPILVIIFGGLIVQFFVGEPAYSLSRDSTYYVQRYTRELRVPYFVKPDFEANYGKKLRQVEQHVEDDYLSMLRTNCYREKNHRESLLWTAKMRGDADMWRRAQEMELTYCKKLEEIYR